MDITIEALQAIQDTQIEIMSAICALTNVLLVHGTHQAQNRTQIPPTTNPRPPSQPAQPNNTNNPDTTPTQVQNPTLNQTLSASLSIPNFGTTNTYPSIITSASNPNPNLTIQNTATNPTTYPTAANVQALIRQDCCNQHSPPYLTQMSYPHTLLNSPKSLTSRDIPPLNSKSSMEKTAMLSSASLDLLRC